MPTRKHRVTVTLEPHTAEIIKRLAELQKRSQASVIAELIEEVAEPLGRTLSLVEAAAAAPKQVREGLRSSAEQMEKQLRQSLGEAGADMDQLMASLEQGKGGGGGRKSGSSGRCRPSSGKGKRGRKQAQPPGSNHGGQVSKKGGS